MNGPDLDFMHTPTGDMALATSYMKKAGFANGKYSGPAIQMVTDNASAQKKVAETELTTLESLGFKVNLVAVIRSTMYSKYCGVPKAKVAVCPSVGWLKDFADPQTVLDPTFNGKNIIPANNSNWPQLNDPAINAAMDKAALLPVGSARNQAWAKINQMIMAQAPGIPYIWDKTVVAASKDINQVTNGYYTTQDLTYTSMK
jgi:peptide/nickel transport system substrate-binding protein